MARTQTSFDALESLARDLGIGLISGQLQPPDAGRLYLGNRSLADIIAPTWGDRRVALVVAAGGPSADHVRAGTGTLHSDDLDRLEQAAHAAGGHVYQGQLAVLTPRDWLERYGNTSSVRPELAPSSAQYGWDDNLSNAETATLDTSPELAAARAAGWPAAFADEPVLFLDDQPLYYILMQEDAGRNVTLLIGLLE